jgi:putative pyruvate formate lyase activating enzyme
MVSSTHLHFGEESPLVGTGGSGTIFFTHCNLSCVYCQNYDISHLGHGYAVTAPQLASLMLRLQHAGAHNINLVSPSHVVAQILEALLLAAQAGLRIPLVFNSGGYDALPTLRLVEGIVDIYMPDAKYGDPEVGQRLSRVDDYPTVNRQAILEMHRQVGPLTLDASGIATRGLLVRHLVLPASLADSRTILRFLAQHVSTTTYVHIMDEYRPCFLASDHEQLARPLRRSEYEFVMQVAREEGLEPR